jgi:GNAT superfamily N-acetyltransferase
MMSTTSQQARERRQKRLIGFSLFAVGLVLMVTAAADFIFAINESVTGEPPTKLWMLLVGLPLVAVGGYLLDGNWLSPPPKVVLELRQVTYDDPDAQRLIAEVQAEYVKRYGGPDETPIAAEMFTPPDGAFFVGYVDGEPVAMGGWRRRPDVQALERKVAAEVKRMYVHAESRRHGLARQVLAHLELTARIAGADLMVMETGTAQPEAMSLYIREGYTSVMPFGYYADSPQSRYYGKAL